ncbi:Uncharacterized protein APZ42_031480 [Daphnia magna]|uniref:Uncharacterized protein n=1 Tax=Daphnia magna TaxID=35525 RepID=A0A164MTT2_9CRUS|nr:Uncharacterized protein APZ42_031480 [Daphnia magna]
MSENRIAVSSYDGKIKIFVMEENIFLQTTEFVKEFTHGKYCNYLEWNERTQYLVSGGDYQLNIWSMDHDMPIYSLKFPLQKEKGELEIEFQTFAWRLCKGNGEEEGGIEMARKSAKNFTFAYACASRDKGVFIWNPLEIEQQPRRLSDDTGIKKLAFSSDGRFLAAGGDEKSMIWSAEDYNIQIYKVNTDIYKPPIRISFFTTKSTNLYEIKFIGRGGSSLFECAFEESNISDSASEIPIEFDEDDDEDVSPPKRLKGSFLKIETNEKQDVLQKTTI